ncbi:MAG: hypothetical protein MHPDNHAH_00621 [Anaerolineales bacterium]|nr:hypothetical protein [Anaerolineales bacterium]
MVGIPSLIGICLIGLITYRDGQQAISTAIPTHTPFKYLFLATEILTPQVTSETSLATRGHSETPSTLTTPEPEDATLEITQTVTAGTLSGSNMPSTNSNPTTSPAALIVLERYDDTDERLEYDGDWTGGIDIQGAFEGTLVTSATVTSDVIFTFEGQQIVIGYLGGSGLGALFISIDDSEFHLNQSTGNPWLSPRFDAGEHFVILYHESGSSVNLDYIDILGTPEP